MGADLCSTFGGRVGTVISVSWPVGYLPHFVAVGRGGGRPLLTRGGSGSITTGKIWIYYIRNHAFPCIFA